MPQFNEDNIVQLGKFFYSRLKEGEALKILEELGIRWAWDISCEKVALSVGKDMLVQHDHMKIFVIQRYVVFRDYLVEMGYIPDHILVGPGSTAGLSLNPIPEELTLIC